ncbi:Gfo/Idh/MocA family protein [Acuticoccus sediminis]|uniref:Gfo/Idh/MocA family protein n=1 Tax=Acuticoccus sediminis TaxID=2184697 RepID=UPI00192E4CEE|nr:Gfo/Idh/MocA family oxidoreductase [Acuticoccus sediminis]
MPNVAIIGCGFVADLYMRSLSLYPEVTVVGAFDIRGERLKAFTDHWKIPLFPSREALFEALPADGLVLNLTNPTAHFEVSRAALEAGRHVYSEKPLAMTMEDAHALAALARSRGLRIGAAPCNQLGESAQLLAAAVRENVAGPVRLAYAEMDDGFIRQAPTDRWLSESGAPWPAADEYATGCTLEHAGYHLGWMMQAFGSVRTVVAASARLAGSEGEAPDFAAGLLAFESGVIARLTCSILAPHNHEIMLVGERGVLKQEKAWANGAPVRFHKRVTVRRRILELPVGRRLSFSGETHRKQGRWGAASMNFALGPVELLEAIASGRPARMSPELALHVTEVTLALQNAGLTQGAQTMATRIGSIEPMPFAARLKT